MKLRSSPLILSKVKKKDDIDRIYDMALLTLLDVELGWKREKKKKGGEGGLRCRLLQPKPCEKKGK